MKALPSGKYGIVHSIEVREQELDALAKKLGIEKPARLRAGTIHIVRELGADEKPAGNKG